MLTISLLTSFGMIIVFGFMYISEKQVRQVHILEFWVCYGTYYVLSILTQGQDPKVVALSSFFWVWRIRTIRLILEDVCGKALEKSWHLPLMVTGYLIGISFGALELSFLAMTLPAGLAVTIVGLDQLRDCYWSMHPGKISVSHKLLLFNATSIFLMIMVYPFVRYNHQFSGLGFGVVLMTTILMAVVLPAVTTFDIQKAQQDFLKKIIDERGLQLEAQSKFYTLGEMTAEIVHEINNPLGIILGRTTHMKNHVKNDEAQKEFLLRNLDQIELTSERMSTIIKSLKKYTKTNPTLAAGNFLLGEVVQETISYCQERFKHKSIQLIVAPIPELEVAGHSVQVSQVILNLLNNAFDAIEASVAPWVHLFVTLTPGSVRIYVKDSGSGIPEHLKKKIMDPFFTTKDKGGTGLGLSISKKIMEEHHGKLFYDESSSNTCFILELPYRPRTHSELAAVKIGERPGPGAQAYSM